MCQNDAPLQVTTTTSNCGDIGGCQWIDWSPSSFWVHKIPDPTRIFSLLCLTIMFTRFLQARDGDVSAAVMGLFLHPCVVFCFATAYVAAHYGRKHAPSSSTRLPIYDQWTAEWYWWNAWLFHAVMDGASGSLRLVPVVVQQYDMLDQRFPTHHTVPWIIGMIELVIMYPLCLATVYAVLSRSPLRYPLELITSSFQIMGMIVFVGSELYEGQVHVPARDPVGRDSNLWANAKLWDSYHLIYYWFGFWFCNLVWGVVPYYRLHRAVCETVRAFQLLAADNRNDHVKAT